MTYKIDLTTQGLGNEDKKLPEIWSAYLEDYRSRVEINDEPLPPFDPDQHRATAIIERWTLNNDLRTNWNARLKIINWDPPFQSLLPKHILEFDSEEDWLAFKLAWS